MDPQELGNLTNEEKLRESVKIRQELLRRKWLESLYFFNKQCLKVEEGKDKVKLNQFHRNMCDFVDSQKHKQKLILVPRGHLKSSLVTIGKTLQWICENPKVRILIANATYSMAVSFLTVIKRHLQNNEMMRLMFGDLAIGAEKWSENSITLSQLGTEGGEKESTVFCYGTGGKLTSQHYDKIILDDVVNEATVATRDQIEKTLQFYQFCQPLLEKDGEMIIIGTRYRDDDLYSWLMDKENGVAQDLLVFGRRAIKNELWDDSKKEFVKGDILWPEKYTLKDLSNVRRKMGPYTFSCTPAETPILMADFTEKPISEIKEGDEIVGFMKERGVKKNKIIKSKVKSVFKKIDFVYHLKMESGRFVRCTKDHKWYTGRFDKSHEQYLPAKRGRKLMFVCPTQYNNARRVLQKNKEWENRYWAYLGGMFDGEGSAKSSSLSITQGVKNEGVCAMIRKTLKGLKIPYKEYLRKNDGNENWHDSISFVLNDSFNTCIKFIRNSEFAKKWQVINKLWKKNGRFVKEKDTVVSMKIGKKEDVYAIETTTGNYIAWGYASSNSQYFNECIPQGNADFKREWFSYYETSDLKGVDLNKYLLIDPAISLEKEADFTALVTVGVDEHNNIYILDILREKEQVDGIIKAIFQQNERWHPSAIGLEQVAFQTALRYSLKKEMDERKRYLNIVELKPHGRNKDSRIRALQPLYANGKVLHNRDLIYTIYLEDELLRFPFGKHDDLIDALAYALDIIHPAVRKVTSNRTERKYLYG